MAGDLNYPKRPSFFAAKAIRAAVKTCVANEHGHGVLALITVIVTTEDAAHYRRPVTYYDSQLAPLVGMSGPTLRRARERAVASGWLQYIPGGHRQVSKYWVTIPDYASGIDDRPTDDDEAEASGENNIEQISAQNLRQSDNQTSPKHLPNVPKTHSKLAPFLPVPNPNPIPKPRKPLKPHAKPIRSGSVRDLDSVEENEGKARKALSLIKAQHLRDTELIVKFHSTLATLGVWNVNASEASVLRVIGTAERALRGENPGGMFNALVQGGCRVLDPADEDAASLRWKEYQSGRAS